MSIEVNHILFPTDFSDLALVALRHARRFAEVFNAQLHCLHVVDEAYQYWSAMGPESVPVGPPMEDLLQLARQRMEQFSAEHLGEIKPEPITEVVLGRPFAQIVAYAEERKMDLIVMGTHGRGAITHMFLGSTTEKVIRKSPCAVLTVRPSDHDFDVDM